MSAECEVRGILDSPKYFRVKLLGIFIKLQCQYVLKQLNCINTNVPNANLHV